MHKVGIEQSRKIPISDGFVFGCVLRIDVLGMPIDEAKFIFQCF